MQLLGVVYAALLNLPLLVYALLWPLWDIGFALKLSIPMDLLLLWLAALSLWTSSLVSGLLVLGRFLGALLRRLCFVLLTWIFGRPVVPCKYVQAVREAVRLLFMLSDNFIVIQVLRLFFWWMLQMHLILLTDKLPYTTFLDSAKQLHLSPKDQQHHFIA